MTQETTLSVVTAELGVIIDTDESEITPSSSLSGDLGVDSLDLLQLLVALRNRFGIEVKDGDAKEMLAELATFLPGAEDAPQADALSDDDLAEIRGRLTVTTIAAFVDGQMQGHTV